MSEFEGLILEDKEYVLNLPYHLAIADMADDLCNILTEFDFIEYKISASETQLLIEDYKLALQFPELNNTASLSLIKSSLQLAAHIFAVYPCQVSEQLLGRLLGKERDDERLQHLLAQAQHQKSEPWLRPLTGSLPRPDGLLLQTIIGHRGMLNAVTVAPDGEYFVSANGTEIKAWSVANGEELFTFPSYNNGIKDLTITPDGQYLVIALLGGIIKVWDLGTKQEYLTLKAHKSAVLAVATTSKGYLISASTDETLKIWNLQQRIAVDTLSANIGSFNGIAVLPGGEQIISASGDLFNSPREHYVLKIWDLTKQKEVYTLGEHSDPVSTVAVTPDGRYAIAGLIDSLVVWDLSTRTKRCTLTGQKSQIQAVVAVNNRLVISASSGDDLKIWDIEGGKVLTTLKGHQDGVSDVAVTPDCKRAISVGSDGTIKIWNLERIEETAFLSRHQDKVTKIVITPDGKRAISTSYDHTAIVWNLENFQSLLTLQGHTNRVTDIAVMADSRHAVSASWDGTLKFWNLTTGKLLSTQVYIPEHINALAVTPDGQYVVLADRGNPLRVWDLDQKIERFILQGHTRNVNAISLTPDGQRVISASDDQTLRVWDLKNGLQLLSFPDGLQDPELSLLPFPVEFSNDLMQVKILGIMIPPDRTQRNPRQSSSLENEKYFVELGKRKNAVAVMPDGRSVISGSQSGVLQIWDTSCGEELFALDDNASGITAIDVSPNGRFAFATSGLPHYLSDNTLRVWDLEKRQVIARFIGESPMTACAVAPDGVTIVVGDASGQVHFFRLEGID
ncbi:hypothetical protein [uncultured Nostoc sp.]|uniref:beta-propeller domain-containing protein n=1 Tax=uncultured Nostoc sp. TaxID=340711 RepID=UPI0035CC6E47